MFRSATLKLTAWYLLILMTISIIFSVAIYSLTSREISMRLQQLQTRVERYQSEQSSPDSTPPPDTLGPMSEQFSQLRQDQNRVADTNLLMSLIYINLLILIAGGTGSYFLARRTLRDIEIAHEAQSRFTSDASHELRTPLAVMKSEIEVILRDKSVSKTELRETLESSLEEVNKLSNLSKVLLQLSKAELQDIAMHDIDTERLLKTVIRRQSQPENRISLTTTADVPLALANETSLEELCMILLDNAVKYSPQDSLVSVRVSRRSNKVCIEFTNTGKGISPEALPHIFDRFYRADASRTGGSQSGYGLGLALAKKIVEIHHGELSVTSAINHATTFTVLLPIFKDSQAKSQK